MSSFKLLAAFTLTLVLAIGRAAASDDTLLFKDPWNGGFDPNEPKFQVQAIDANTFAIRQSIRTTFEAPFMYLLFGNGKILLIDTGVEGDGLRAEVDKLIGAWRAGHAGPVPALVVMHTHAHADHVGSDKSFAGRPNTTIVAHGATEVASFFAIKDWPTASATFDLGGRRVEILPTPGHHDSHVMVYDAQTQLLFSGDTIYPGRIYFRCDKARALLSSIERIDAFASQNKVRWVLGAHIEMTAKPGEIYAQDGIPAVPGQALAPDAKMRRNEHALELPPSIIADIRRALAPMVDRPRPKVEDHFMLYPHPADPRGKQPPDWCVPEASPKPN
jgi:hydroxyacylglutathione hydrolase